MILLITIWYFFIVNFLPTAVCGISHLVYITVFPPEANYDKRLHYVLPNQKIKKNGLTHIHFFMKYY